ncbi:NAD(P)H-dependent FMN reductase [Flavobacterium sp. 1]|uniref:NADPH-dependent FMN reductase n=1 Tax=Flavobacterium sp. 1 TaxID=2035200 RepID=UPI000C24F6B8|nr:NADPH-dependent FMN reductase [Flavobacterium sp. 1]PJJ07126.1 NAD(P)H-dependent FMN reductase [Flavobacterium sp. 1]
MHKLGSTRENSINLQIVKAILKTFSEKALFLIFDTIADMPHFNPDLDNQQLPESIHSFREEIRIADGILICTPKYVLSLPRSFKNGLEWTVSTTLLSKKPVALITASGEKAQEELNLIMKTLEAKFNDNTTLLIKGARGKADENGNIKDEETTQNLKNLITHFLELL